jgi:hypothetical protein
MKTNITFRWILAAAGIIFTIIGQTLYINSHPIGLILNFIGGMCIGQLIPIPIPDENYQTQLE